MSVPYPSTADSAHELGPRQKDGVRTLLTVFLGLLFFIPSTFVVKGLGAAGTPANIAGLLCLVAWLVAVRQRTIPLPSVTGRVFVALLSLVTALAAFASTHRAVTGEESRAILRWFIIVASIAGVILLTAEGTRTRNDLDRLLGLLAWFGGILGVIAVIQFFYGWNLAPVFRHIPLLDENQPFDSYIQRGDFRRVEATAAHPIELGFVLAMLTPIAINRAVTAVTRRWIPVVQVLLMVTAMALSLSRSAVVELAIVVLVLLPALPKGARRCVYAGCLLIFAVLRLAQPRLTKVLVSLFTQASTDTSITHRTGDYETVAKYFGQHPWFGRGLGTFLPDHYVTLDNQYLLSILEIGVVGLAVLIAVFFLGIRNCTQTTKLVGTAAARLHSRSLIAGFLATAAGFAFFDAMSFPLGRDLFFFLFGASCAMYRFALTDAQAAEPTEVTSPEGAVETVVREPVGAS